MTPRRPIWSLCLFCLASLCFPHLSLAQIYGGTSEGGRIVLSNFASAEARSLLIPAAAPGVRQAPPEPVPSNRASVIPIAFKKLIEEVARQHRVDPILLHAIVKVESSYNPRAQSSKGARGLMQLMPDTARRFGVVDPFNPRQNLSGGAKYLGWLLELFHGDVELALAGYNAGEQAVIRAGYHIPDCKETRKYVPKVLAHYKPDALSRP